MPKVVHFHAISKPRLKLPFPLIIKNRCDNSVETNVKDDSARVDLEHAYSCGRQSEQKVKLLFNSLVDLEHTYSCGRQANQKVRHESAAESSSSNTIRTGNLIIECDRNEEDFVESCASNDRSVPVASSSRLQQAVSINLNSNVSGRSSTSSAASHYFLPSTAVDALPVQISDISSTSTSIDENLLSTDESVFRTE